MTGEKGFEMGSENAAVNDGYDNLDGIDYANPGGSKSATGEGVSPATAVPSDPAPTGEDGGAVSTQPATGEPDNRTQGLETAVSEARKRAQKAELENQRLMGELEAFRRFSSPHSVAQEPKEDPFDYASPTAYVESLVEKKLEQRIFNERMTQSRLRAESKHPDYNEVIGEFMKEAERQKLQEGNTYLEATVMNHPDPAQWAYNWMKTQREIKKHGSIEEIKAQARKEVLDEIEQSKRAKAASGLPPTNAGGRSPGTNVVAGKFSTEPSEDDLYGNKGY